MRGTWGTPRPSRIDASFGCDQGELRRACGDGSAAGDACAQQRLGDAVDDEVGIAADGRSEVGISGRGEGEVAFVDLGVARLRERTQHEVAQDALLGLAFNARGQLLIHARRDGDVLWHLVLAGIAAAGRATRGALHGFGLACTGSGPRPSE